MGNPSKITLYIASMMRGGGATTVIKPKITISSEQVRDALRQRAPYLVDLLESEKEERRYEGDVRLPASLDEAALQLLNYVAPAAAVFRLAKRRLGVDVMFNEMKINNAVKNGWVDKWRSVRFEHKSLNQPIAYASKWYAMDVVLQELGGRLVWYNGDKTMRELVDSLKPKYRR